MLNKTKILSGRNEKFFDALTKEIFSTNNLKEQNLFNYNPFYSHKDFEIKKTLKKITDQRCLGYVKAFIESNDGKSNFLKKYREQGNLKVRLIKNYNQNDELVIINTAGGLTSGDLNFSSINIGEGAIINLTTQSMEKVYKCKNLFGHSYTNIIAGPKSNVFWFPLETIFYNEGKLRRRINIEVDVSSNFLGVESIIFGRKAMGETVSKGELDDAWQIYRNGKLLYSDFNRINGNINQKLGFPLIMRGNSVLSNLVYTGKKIKTYKNKIIKLIDKTDIFAGTSVVNDVLLIKILAKDIIEIRFFLEKLINILDTDFSLPKIWSY